MKKWRIFTVPHNLVKISLASKFEGNEGQEQTIKYLKPKLELIDKLYHTKYSKKAA